ncbi:MAG: hypothetical protein L0212_07480 [Acidobacteria bacterium]|nr:hypothetical protein [Acidobacteriota bacterium]
MQIQYIGFNVAATSRTYNFRVADALGATRDFSVKVLLSSFRSSALKFQDGPELCHGRLKQALEAETADSPLQSNLNIELKDTEDFLRRRYPRKRRG